MRAASRELITIVFSNSSAGSSPSLSTKRSVWWPTVMTSSSCSACFLMILPLTYVPFVLFRSSRNESLRMLITSAWWPLTAGLSIRMSLSGRRPTV